MAKMGHGKLHVGHKNFITFTGPQGAKFIERSKELLMITSL